MRYSSDQVVQGIINYADNEIINKLPIASKWILGTGIVLAANKVDKVVDSLRDNSVVKMFGLVDEDGMIEVDELMNAMKESADKYGKISFDVGMIGKMTFTSSDIDELRRYIV